MDLDQLLKAKAEDAARYANGGLGNGELACAVTLAQGAGLVTINGPVITKTDKDPTGFEVRLAPLNVLFPAHCNDQEDLQFYRGDPPNSAKWVFFQDERQAWDAAAPSPAPAARVKLSDEAKKEKP